VDVCQEAFVPLEQSAGEQAAGVLGVGFCEVGGGLGVDDGGVTFRVGGRQGVPRPTAAWLLAPDG